MKALVDAVDEHAEAVEYDLMRCGARLRDWPDGGVSWRDLWVLIRQAQPGSAVYKALTPHWQRTPELQLLQSVELSLRVLAWQQTADGQKGRNAPEPAWLPWDEKPEDDAIRGDAMTVDEALDWLGWSREMRE